MKRFNRYNIRWTFDFLDAPAGRFPAPVDLRPLVEGEPFAAALDGPAAALSFPAPSAFALGTAVILRPFPVFGGMVMTSLARLKMDYSINVQVSQLVSEGQLYRCGFPCDTHCLPFRLFVFAPNVC